MTTAHVQVLKQCISSCKATQMSTVASQSISDLPLEITYVSSVLYTLEPPKKDTLGPIQNQSICLLFRGCP